MSVPGFKAFTEVNGQLVRKDQVYHRDRVNVYPHMNDMQLGKRGFHFCREIQDVFIMLGMKEIKCTRMAHVVGSGPMEACKHLSNTVCGRLQVKDFVTGRYPCKNGRIAVFNDGYFVELI